MKKLSLFVFLLCFVLLTACNNKFEEKAAQLQVSVDDLQKQNSELQSELTAKKKEVKSLEIEVNRLRNRVQTFKEQVAALESSQLPIEVIIHDFYDNSSGSKSIVNGEVKNVSNASLSSVLLRATFTDKEENIIKTSDTYAKVNPLLPGAVSKYETTIDFDPRIEGVIVELVDYIVE